MTTKLMIAALAALALSGLAAGTAQAADAAAGKLTYDKICGECHEFKDYAGKSAADVDKLLHQFMAREKKHKKKLALSDEEVANVALYATTAK